MGNPSFFVLHSPRRILFFSSPFLFHEPVTIARRAFVQNTGQEVVPLSREVGFLFSFLFFLQRQRGNCCEDSTKGEKDRTPECFAFLSFALDISVAFSLQLVLLLAPPFSHSDLDHVTLPSKGSTGNAHRHITRSRDAVI